MSTHTITKPARAQHTPGPWEISKHGTPAAFPQFGIYADGHRNDHCIVTGENAEIDARLIAAAPELLAALLAFLEWTEDGTPDGSRSPAEITARKIASAAITKATQP